MVVSGQLTYKFTFFVMERKKIRKSTVTIIELCLLFAVFFLPGYLSQSSVVDGALFSSPRFNVVYILSGLPQIALLLYILLIRGRAWPAFPYLTRFGIKPFRFPDVAKALLIYLGIFGVYIVFLLVSLAVGAGNGSVLVNNIDWRLDTMALLPLVFLTMLTTGYREEIFFRSYLITRLEELGFPGWSAGILGSALFAAGHMYQGVAAFVGTFLIGVFLSAVFLRVRNLHALAIAHGLYNFTTILLISLLPDLHGFN